MNPAHKHIKIKRVSLNKSNIMTQILKSTLQLKLEQQSIKITNKNSSEEQIKEKTDLRNYPITIRHTQYTHIYKEQVKMLPCQ